VKEQSFSTALRNLAWEYYNHRLEFQDYRAQRRRMLDEIDREYNGADDQTNTGDPESSDPVSMGTVIFSVNDNDVTDT